jgi:hypothetical protein
LQYGVEAAIIMATETITPSDIGTGKIYKNLIDGEWVEATTGETFENINPADTREVVGIFQKSGKSDVEAAVDAAKRAFAKWRTCPRRAAPRSSTPPRKCSSSARNATPAT